MKSMPSIKSLLAALVVATLSANAFCDGPQLPVDLDLLNDWAAGQIGVEPTDCDDVQLPEGLDGRYNKPLFPWSDGSVEVDVEQIVKAYSVHTDEALGVLVQGVLLHEYMHVAGYGSESGSGLHPEHPFPWIPEPADCEHFHMHVSDLHHICDAITNWNPPTSPHDQEVLDELCQLYELLSAGLEASRAEFTYCGVMPKKEFPGGYVIPEFDPSKQFNLCHGC